MKSSPILILLIVIIKNFMIYGDDLDSNNLNSNDLDSNDLDSNDLDSNDLDSNDLDSKDVHQRRKRWLVWEDGINWVQMVIGIGLPIDVPNHSVTWGVVFRSYYLLPTNASQYTNPLAYNDVSRKKRTPTRFDLYSALEYFSESSGLGNGRACLLRSICEISSTPLETRNGLLSEILHLLLTPSSTEEIPISHSDHEYWAAEKLGKETENCAVLFPECSGSLVARFTRLAKGFM